MIRGTSQLAMEGRQIVVHRHGRIAQTLMGNNQRQRQTETGDIAGELIQQQKQLLIERRQMVLFATRVLVVSDETAAETN
jgi:hypothetical protein